MICSLSYHRLVHVQIWMPFFSLDDAAPQEVVAQLRQILRCCVVQADREACMVSGIQTLLVVLVANQRLPESRPHLSVLGGEHADRVPRHLSQNINCRNTRMQKSRRRPRGPASGPHRRRWLADCAGSRARSAPAGSPHQARRTSLPPRPPRARKHNVQQFNGQGGADRMELGVRIEEKPRRGYAGTF